MEDKLLMAIVFLSQALMFGWRALDKRKPTTPSNGNGNGKSGAGKITSLCMDHETRITSNEKDCKNLKDSLSDMRTENRDDHAKIFRKLDELAK